MKPTIEHPKIFISYAWGSQEYQDRVLTLARDLQSDGIEVLFDKWSLKEGHDTYSYMEHSVNDPTVTNVIILLDPLYEKKANERAGGVGTETQIISPEIYNKVTQEKFIPIVMERADDNTVPKPRYLKGILHFDLSIAERYDDEYQRLVKRLYGVEVYPKPDIGNMPKWVTEDSPITGKKRTALNSLKKNNNQRVARLEFIELLDDLRSRIVNFNNQNDNYIQLYDEMLPYRDEYLQMVKTSFYVNDSSVLVGDFLQELYWDINESMIELKDLKQVLLHELFLYTVAIYNKTKDYDSLAYFLNRSFFGQKHGSNPKTGFGIYYHCSFQLDSAKKAQDDKNYYSGTAQHWIDNIASDFCNKKEFVFADVLLYNYAFFGANYGDNWPWFPITYVYDGEHGTILQNTAYQMKSKEVALRWAKVFGFDTEIAFRDNVKSIVEVQDSKRHRRSGYPMSFIDPQLLSDFIKSEEIATMR